MENHALNQSVIIMTGMHRSGTSLTASLLQSAGVQIGDRLMGSANGNVKGHFEDLDFVEFHQNVLQSQGISIAGWTEQSRIEVQQQYLAQAQNLILARNNQAIWGWKDPRTTLFLDFWLKLIPDAKCIFLYRSPWEVVDSLFRRGDVIFRTNPNFAVHQWCHYNQAVLDFYQRYPEQCLLLEIGSIIENFQGIIDLIKQKFNLELRSRSGGSASSPESLYEPSLFNADSNIYYRQALITKFFPQALDLYHQLQQHADANHPTKVEQQAINLTCEAWILQDWHDLQHTTKEKQQVAAELTQTQQQLQSAQTKLAQTQQHLQHLESTQTQVAETQKQSELQLKKLTERLSQSEKQLQIAQKEIEKFGSLVRAMESSKFWQFRQQWFKLKQQLNIQSSDSIYEDYRSSVDANLSANKLTSSYSEGTYLNSNRNYLKWIKRNFPQKTALKKIARVMRSQLLSSTAVDIKEAAQSRDPKYQKWLEQNYPQPETISKIRAASLALAYQPLISVIVPVYNPEQNFLRQAIESVIAQAYPNWELCLADDRSTKPYVKEILEEYAGQDERIKIVLREENGHICRASNSALEVATGEYIALLDHDDLLAPHALAEVVKLLNQHPEADFIYSDEDKVDEQNIHKDPYFKPDWCPDSFLSRMYTCHLGVYRRSLVTEVGNFRVGFEGSQDYDLVLRVTEKTNHIFHIPDVLYHWRIHFQSTAAYAEAKPYAYDAGQKAITEAIARRGEPGEVTTKLDFPGVYTIRYQIKEPKLVSIIIPTKDLADTLDVCLRSIFTKTTYPNYEVIVIDNGSVEAKTQECFESWQQQQGDRFQVYQYDVPFNYSQINNYGVAKAQGDYLLFLNNDTEVITPDWLEAMIEQAQRPSIGAVGSLLLYPDDTVQHAGVVLGIGGVAGHSHKNFHVSQSGYISQLVSTNNYSALTAACLMCRRGVFESVGGFEEQLAIAFNDVDFCLKIISQGYRNIYLPHVVLYHYESKSRGYEDTPEKQMRFAGEINYMKQKWQELCVQDPCYNCNLTRNHEDYSLNI
jgi:glycosyltransferase involved in cell wall biosynthesis